MMARETQFLAEAPQYKYPGEILDMLDNGLDADLLLGRQEINGQKLSAKNWVESHALLLNDLRQLRSENKSYSCIREGVLCTTRLADLGTSKPTGKDVELVQDMPYTTLLYPGSGTFPPDQMGRQNYMEQRMKKVKKAIFLVGGLLENRLALEGMGVDILKGLNNPEEYAIFIISHSGAENSYKQGANLKSINWESEMQIIDAGMKRILAVNSLELPDVAGMILHSKAGLLGERLVNQGEYINAAVVELAPVIMGTRLSKNKSKQKPWIRAYNHVDKPHVIVQQGGYNTLISIALRTPDMRLRDAIIDMVGPHIAEHFVGREAAYSDEAVAAITHELKRNKRAIIAQQRSLAGMPMIVDNFDETSLNPRLVVPAGEDKTLAKEHQIAYKAHVNARLTTSSKGYTVAAGLRGRHSPHNATHEVVEDVITWFNYCFDVTDSPDNLRNKIEAAAKATYALLNT